MGTPLTITDLMGIEAIEICDKYEIEIDYENKNFQAPMPDDSVEYLQCQIIGRGRWVFTACQNYRGNRDIFQEYNEYYDEYQLCKNPEERKVLHDEFYK